MAQAAEVEVQLETLRVGEVDGDVGDLANSIRMYGQLCAIEVAGDLGGYRVVDGRRRVKAMRLLGLSRARARVVEGS